MYRKRYRKIYGVTNYRINKNVFVIKISDIQKMFLPKKTLYKTEFICFYILFIEYETCSKNKRKQTWKDFFDISCNAFWWIFCHSLSKGHSFFTDFNIGNKKSREKSGLVSREAKRNSSLKFEENNSIEIKKQWASSWRCIETVVPFLDMEIVCQPIVISQCRFLNSFSDFHVKFHFTSLFP